MLLEQQLGFSDLDFSKTKHVIRKGKFSAKMDIIILWHALEERIAPYYPKASNGRKQPPLSSILPAYCLQQWYTLSDTTMEDVLYETASIIRFAKPSLGNQSLTIEQLCIFAIC